MAATYHADLADGQGPPADGQAPVWATAFFETLRSDLVQDVTQGIRKDVPTSGATSADRALQEMVQKSKEETVREK